MCEGGRRNRNIIGFSTKHFRMVPRTTYEKSPEILPGEMCRPISPDRIRVDFWYIIFSRLLKSMVHLEIILQLLLGWRLIWAKMTGLMMLLCSCLLQDNMYWKYNLASNDLHPTNDKSLSKGAIMTFLLLLPLEISSIIVSFFICLYAEVELVISLATMSGPQSHLDTLSREHFWNALICTSDKYCQDTCVVRWWCTEKHHLDKLHICPNRGLCGKCLLVCRRPLLECLKHSKNPYFYSEENVSSSAVVIFKLNIMIIENYLSLSLLVPSIAVH